MAQLNEWPDALITKVAKTLVNLAKTNEKIDTWEAWDEEERAEYDNDFATYMKEVGLENQLDSGLFEELETYVVEAARNILESK